MKLSFTNAEKTRHDFHSFSQIVSRKQEELSNKHKIMQKEHNNFKNKIDKKIQFYSK